MDSQIRPSGSYTWRINNYSRLTQRKYYSEVFNIRGCKWMIFMYPKGNNSDHFVIYMSVPDAESLPAGWSREAYFTLTVINQNDGSFSTRRETMHVFDERTPDCGYSTFMPLSDLRNLRKGFVVNDTVFVKAEVDVLSVVPPVVIPEANAVPSVVNARPVMETNHFDSFFTDLEEFIVITETKEGSSSNNGSNCRIYDSVCGSPSLEEVELAKQSLKECLSDIFKLNMKNRLTAALLTLKSAEVGLSSNQQRSVRAFWENFDDFVSDFLTFEQDNSEFELQKLVRDQMFSSMKKNHQAHLSNKQLMEALTKEEQEIGKRLEEVNLQKEKLISDWDSLKAKSGEIKPKYIAQEKKLAEAEEKKKIAEERMSRSAAAWSSLKTHFLVITPSYSGLNHELQ